MFTLFDLFELLGAVLGCASGIFIGAAHHGWLGGLLGAPLGVIAGTLCGRLPFLAALLFARWHLRRQSPAELRQRLRGDVWPAYHLFLTELRRRGEDVTQELPLMLPLLTAEDPVKRIHGWAILRGMYPREAERIPDYNPGDPVEMCRAKMEKGGLAGPPG
jgi:hypothetical protein